MSSALRPLLLILAIAFGLPAQAQDEGEAASSGRESAGDRVRQVERDGGRVLQAESMQRSGREVYRLKVLTPEGRVRVLDDSRRHDGRAQDSFERRRQGRYDGGRSLPSERLPREPEARRDQPAPERMDDQRGPPGGDGRGRSPNY